MQTMSCQRIIVKPSIVRTIGNAIVLIWIYLYYLWDGSSTWRKKNDNLKLLLFLFCLNLWKFQGYDRVAVVSDKIDKQKYTTYLAPHARLPVDVLDFSNIVYGCTDIHTYIRYSLIDLQLLFLLPFQLSAWVVYLYRCVFFIFWFNVCPHFVRFVFKLLFCFFFFLSIVFVVVLECTNIYLQRCF